MGIYGLVTIHADDEQIQLSDYPNSKDNQTNTIQTHKHTRARTHNKSVKEKEMKIQSILANTSRAMSLYIFDMFFFFM